MTIISQITTYDENSYQLLNDYLENSYVELTFWGKRSVRALGYEGSIKLADLFRKISLVYHSHKEINDQELELYKKIECKVRFLDDIGDEQINRANFFTKWLASWRDSSSWDDLTTALYSIPDYKVISRNYV